MALFEITEIWLCLVFLWLTVVQKSYHLTRVAPFFHYPHMSLLPIDAIHTGYIIGVLESK